jgi:hypothetical protein
MKTKLAFIEVTALVVYTLGVTLGLLVLCLASFSCAGPSQGLTTACAYQGNGEVCVLIVVGEPEAVLVKRMHLGKMQTYVANVPKNWKLHHEVARWPRMIPNACLDDYNLCRWMVVEVGDACERLKLLPNVQSAVGW